MGYKPQRVLHSSPLATQIQSRGGRELWSQNNMISSSTGSLATVQTAVRIPICARNHDLSGGGNVKLLVVLISRQVLKKRGPGGKGKHVSTGKQPLTQHQLSPSSEFPSFHSCFTSISISLHLPPPSAGLFIPFYTVIPLVTWG